MSAITSTPLTSTRSTPTTTTLPTSELTENYLQRCVEVITHSSELVQSFEWEATSCKAWAIFYGFVTSILALGSLIATGIFAQTFLPVAGIGGAALGGYGLNKYQNLTKQAVEYQDAAKKIRDIAAEYYSFPVQNNFLAAVNVSIASGLEIAESDAANYKPLLAEYNYWNHKFLENERDENLLIHAAQNEPSREKRAEHYAAANIYRQKALADKVAAAFSVAVMLNPSFAHSAKDIGKNINFELPIDYAHTSQETGIVINANLKHNPWAARALFQEFGDPSVDQFYVFNDQRIAPLTTADVQVQSIKQIGQRILQAMQLPPLSAPV